MAFLAAARNYLKPTLMIKNGKGGIRPFASSTTPKMKLFAPTVDSVHSHQDHPKSRMAEMKGDFAPIMVVLGMVGVAVSIGAHTAKQQLLHSPGVQVNKKRRECVQEVEDPDHVIRHADKLLNKSFLRKVAHIQDHDRVLPDPVRANPYTRTREIETLKSVGALE